MTASKCSVVCDSLYFEGQNLSSGCTGYDCFNFLFQNPTVGVIKLWTSHMSCPFNPFQIQTHKRDGQNITSIYISEHHKTLEFKSHSARAWRSLSYISSAFNIHFCQKNVSWNSFIVYRIVLSG
jgi:hypothetical protein